MNAQTPGGPRFLLGALSGAFVMLVLCAGVMLWSYAPWSGPPRNPDGSVDNAFVRSTGILVALTPVAYAITTAALYAFTRIMDFVKCLRLWVLVLAASTFSTIVGIDNGADYYRTISEKSDAARTVLGDAIFQGAVTATALAVISIIGCVVWWKIALRQPNQPVESDAIRRSPHGAPQRQR